MSSSICNEGVTDDAHASRSHLLELSNVNYSEEIRRKWMEGWSSS